MPIRTVCYKRKSGTKRLIFELSKTAGWGLVAFQIARQLRCDLADEIGRDFHDLRRSCANRRANFGVNLVPGRRFVTGNVKCFTHSCAPANQPPPAQPRNHSPRLQSIGFSPSSGTKTCLPCSSLAANGNCRWRIGLGDPAFRISWEGRTIVTWKPLFLCC